MEPLELSRRYLQHVREGRSTDTVKQGLETLSVGVVRATLQTDTRKRVFWINIYNAVVRDTLRHNPAALEQRLRFFRRPAVTIAGHPVSLNTIEHGILRRNRPAAALGYIRVPAVSRFKRAMQPTTVDPRIHFLLNCGALSCPPIVLITEETYSSVADKATRAYLQKHVEHNTANDIVQLPRIFKWYSGDFGGKSGIIEFLRDYDIVAPDISPTISYQPYDWTVDENPFR